MSDYNEKALLASISESITKLAEAKNITKRHLNSVALNILVLNENGYTDSRILNRTLASLNRPDGGAFRAFMVEFMPCSWNEDTGRFGKNIDNAEKINAIAEARDDFLLSGATFWEWEKVNVKHDKKPVDWAKRVTSAIVSAMDEEKGGLKQRDIVDAIIKGGITAEALLDILRPDEKVIQGEVISEQPAITVN